jgi:hypothetical protein
MLGMGRVEARGRAWGMERRDAAAGTDRNRFIGAAIAALRPGG